MSETKRLNKYISDSGYCSRREADDYIEDGQVLVNDGPSLTGTQVSEGDKVVVNGFEIVSYIEKVYLAFNKPPGITCTTDKKDPTNIVDYVGYRDRIFPIGRIDKDSEGLIFLTNDGDIVNQILRAGNNHEKEYVVSVDHVIDERFLRKMSEGVKIHHTTTLPCKVTRLKSNTFKIILTQGLNKQIRLMCETLGYNVINLKRTRIMDIDVKGIQTGMYRHLSKAELESILEAVAFSSKTEEASKLKGRNSTAKGKGKAQHKSNRSVRFDKMQAKKAGTYKKKKSPIRNTMKSKKKNVKNK